MWVKWTRDRPERDTCAGVMPDRERGPSWENGGVGAIAECRGTREDAGVAKRSGIKGTSNIAGWYCGRPWLTAEAAVRHLAW